MWWLHLISVEVGHHAVNASGPAQCHSLDAAVGAGVQEQRPEGRRGARHGARRPLTGRWGAAELQPEVSLEARIVHVTFVHHTVIKDLNTLPVRVDIKGRDSNRNKRNMITAYDRLTLNTTEQNHKYAQVTSHGFHVQTVCLRDNCFPSDFDDHFHFTWLRTPRWCLCLAVCDD